MTEQTKDDRQLLASLIGMTAEAASALCKEHDYYSRTVREDSHHFIITCDLRTDRINFELDNGVITECSIY